jgi:hypothetical protein
MMKMEMSGKMFMPAKIELLETLFTLEQDELHEFVYEVLKEYYGEDNIIESDEEFMFAIGETPVLVLAHLDTVHKTKPHYDEIFHDQKKNIMWSPRGIGADDRCGVFIVLNLIFAGYKPHVAFTWNEEVGGLGSRAMASKFLPIQAGVDINFAIQFDRRGHQEAVYYDLDNLDFEEYINSFGFKTHIGSYTDICEICPVWGFAGVNLSAGYVNEHTSGELVLLETVSDTLSKAQKILEDQISAPSFFEYKEQPRRYYGSTATSTSGSYAYGYEDDYYYDDYPLPQGWQSTGLTDYNDDVPEVVFECSYCQEETLEKDFSNIPGTEDLCRTCYNYLYVNSRLMYTPEKRREILGEVINRAGLQ